MLVTVDVAPCHGRVRGKRPGELSEGALREGEQVWMDPAWV